VAVYKSLVFVLKCQDWSESSQVIHLLAREVGRLRCLAKGSARGLNPFGGPLDRWTLGEAVFSLRDPTRLATLMEAYETERFEGLRERLPAYFGGCYITELVMALVPDADPQPDLFDLVVEAMRALAAAEAEACQAVTFAAAWRVLAALGYGPDMGQCVECGQALEAGAAATFSVGVGGAVCEGCRAKATGLLPLSAQSAKAVTFLAKADWGDAARVRLSKQTAAQVRSVLGARIAELAGRELSAARFV